MAGAMCGFIALTIAMDIATMSTSGGSSAAILQAPATAVAGEGFIGSTTVGICERWDRSRAPIGDNIRNRQRLPALGLQAGNNTDLVRERRLGPKASRWSRLRDRRFLLGQES